MDHSHTRTRIPHLRRQAKTVDPNPKGNGVGALQVAEFLRDAADRQNRNSSEIVEAVTLGADVPFSREEVQQACRFIFEANMRVTSEAMPAMIEAIGILRENAALAAVQATLQPSVEGNPDSASPIQSWTSNVLLEHAYVHGHVLPSDALRRAFPSRKPVRPIPEFRSTTE